MDATNLERRFPRRLLLASTGGAVAVGAADAIASAADAATPSTAWKLGGNASVATNGSNFIGPTNVAPIIFKTKAAGGALSEKMRLTPNGSLGLGTRAPSARFDVEGTGAIPMILGNTSSTDPSATGVWGITPAGFGVRGDAPSGSGVYGKGTTGVVGHGTSIGVTGEGAFTGVFGQAGEAGLGVYGSSGPGGYGLYTDGDCHVEGNLYVLGNLSKSAGSFKIDHPLDPENKWLLHSFVESPDMMNVYNGNVVLDDAGEAVVELPHYFHALNRDFRYQLTPIGAPAPSLHIGTPIAHGSFRIAGGTPGCDVSWQVTGIRQDAYAAERPIVVEVTKSDAERGRLAFVPAGSSARQLRPASLERALAAGGGR